MSADELATWADRLEATVLSRRLRIVERVVVLRETASTQDAARAHSGGRAGTLVVAGKQSAGRGRLGRTWVQREGLGVAMTLTVDGDAEAWRVSLAAGVAAAEAVIASVPGGEERIGVRWPNDVVERGGGRRKIAGVLIERAERVHVVGIGVNVLQAESDWAAELRGRAASVRELGGTAQRVDVMERVIAALDAALSGEPAELIARWRARDVLVGTRAVFEHAGTRVAGVVASIEPRHEIAVRIASGEVITLPALSTSMVHEP